MTKPQIQSEPKPPFPEQKLPKPGLEKDLKPRPRYHAPNYKAAGKLEGCRALITGGDSGIGPAVAVLFAREGADVAITALPPEAEDAKETCAAIEAEGRRSIVIEGDLTDAGFCQAGYQNRKDQPEDVRKSWRPRTYSSRQMRIRASLREKSWR